MFQKKFDKLNFPTKPCKEIKQAVFLSQTLDCMMSYA